MKIANLALAVSLVIVPAAVLAQTTTTTPTTPTTTTTTPTTPTTTSTTPAGTTTPVKKGATIRQRKENQQDRIAQGVKSGTLSPSETSRLEHQEAGINKEERGMRAQDNGKLTASDRKLIAKQQNQESKRIYRAKHDGKGK